MDANAVQNAVLPRSTLLIPAHAPHLHLSCSKPLSNLSKTIRCLLAAIANPYSASNWPLDVRKRNNRAQIFCLAPCRAKSPWPQTSRVCVRKKGKQGKWGGSNGSHGVAHGGANDRRAGHTMEIDRKANAFRIVMYLPAGSALRVDLHQ